MTCNTETLQRAVRYEIEQEWPIIEPLSSYGRGRERLGGRHIGLIDGDALTNVTITDMTVMAPLNARKGKIIDGLDSSTKVCILDCYIESGDDLVAVQSGWDQYGINKDRPGSNIIARRVSGAATFSGVGIGSEMSAGDSNVNVEDLQIQDSAAGVRIKTDKGRGGYVVNITINNIRMQRVKIPVRFSRGSNDAG